MEKDKEPPVKAYVLDQDQLCKLRCIADRLCGRSDRERDEGNLLVNLWGEIADQPHEDDKEFRETWGDYLRDLQALLRPHFNEEQWKRIFKRTDTPAQAADKLLISGDRRKEPLQVSVTLRVAVTGTVRMTVETDNADGAHLLAIDKLVDEWTPEQVVEHMRAITVSCVPD